MRQREMYRLLASIAASVHYTSACRHTSPSAAAVTPAASNAAATPKRGLAYNNAALLSAFEASDKITWAWNWDSRAYAEDLGLEFVPTLWAPTELYTAQWTGNVHEQMSSGATHLFSFNECDIPSQCNKTPQDAADGHVEYMNPHHGRAKLGAPSVSNSDQPGQGLAWLRSWVEACASRGCLYDFCNAHWYGLPEEAEDLYAYIESVSQVCDGKPVWLTEFAPRANDAWLPPDTVAAWLEGVLPVLDAMPVLERYSYFMVADGMLVDGKSLTPAGKVYFAA